MQTRTWSFIETCMNVGVGYFIAIAIQLVVFPIYGIEIRLDQNAQIAMIFTVVSIIRMYLTRRVFNWYHYLRG